jgi:hypothetical protein
MISDIYMWPTVMAGILLILVIGIAILWAWHRGRLVFRPLDACAAFLSFGLMFNAAGVGYQMYNINAVGDGSTDLGNGLMLLRLGFLNVLVLSTFLVLVMLYRQRAPVSNRTSDENLLPVDMGKVGPVGKGRSMRFTVGASALIAIALIANGLLIRDGLRSNVEIQNAFIEYCELVKGSNAHDESASQIALECKATAHNARGASY